MDIRGSAIVSLVNKKEGRWSLSLCFGFSRNFFQVFFYYLYVDTSRGLENAAMKNGWLKTLPDWLVEVFQVNEQSFAFCT